MLFNTFDYLMQTRIGAIEGLQIPTRATIRQQIRAWIMKVLPKRSQSNGEVDQKKNDQKKNDSRLAVDIMEKLKGLESISSAESIGKTIERCWEYLEYARFTEIPDETEMKKLKENLGDEKECLSKLLEKFGRFFVLDITREVFLLRQIKDIQDELEMMSKVFADQKEVIEAMDRIIRTMIQSKLGSDGSKRTRISITESNTKRSLENLNPERERSDASHNYFIQRKRSNTFGYVVLDDYSSTSGDEDSSAYGSLGDLPKGPQKKKDFMKQSICETS